MRRLMAAGWADAESSRPAVETATAASSLTVSAALAAARTLTPSKTWHVGSPFEVLNIPLNSILGITNHLELASLRVRPKLVSLLWLPAAGDLIRSPFISSIVRPSVCRISTPLSEKT
jgi:hypothetical protein